MKLVHVSDLHLGKRVNDVSMIEEQRDMLNQVIQLLEKEKPDGILIAGDVYDRTIPSEEAVSLFDSFLNAMVALTIPVYLISGNHDSGERLRFGAKILSKNQLYFSTVYQGEVPAISTEDEYGTVVIHLLPFIKPAQVRSFYPEEEIKDYNDALQVVVNHMNVDASKRNVLVAHQLITGATRSDSEEIWVGGLDNCDAKIFQPFDYVALGHLHGPQKVMLDTIRYSGTLLKYSFSEVNQNKSITMIELKGKGEVVISTIPVKPLRDLQILRGTYEELMSRDYYKNLKLDNYFKIVLLDENDVIDGARRLSTVYPNILQVEYDNKRTRTQQEFASDFIPEKKTPVEHFQTFYKIQNNVEMDQEQLQCVTELMGEIWEDER